jgi:hypothetical protein
MDTISGLGIKMLTRYVFIMMLTIASWLPFQSVAAWAMMNVPETSESTDVMSDTNKTAMSSACQSTMTACDTDMTTDAHHSMQQCIYCVSFYGGVFQLPEFLPQASHRHQRSLPLYDDHIPVVLSPPPVNFIA